MKRISAIGGLCLAAAIVVSAIGAVTASATPPLLLLKIASGTYPAEFTSKGGVSTLTSGGTTVTCQKVKNTGKLGEGPTETGTVNAHLGTTTIVFEECETTILGHKGPCSNIAETKNIQLVGAPFHFGSTLKIKKVESSAVPGALVLLNNGTFSFECTEVPILGKVTIKVTGEGLGPNGAGVVGLILTTSGTTPAINTKFPALNLAFEETTPAGTQKHTEFLLPLEQNKLMAGINLLSENSALKKVEKAAQVSVDTLENFKNSAKVSTEVEIVEG